MCWEKHLEFCEWGARQNLRTSWNIYEFENKTISSMEHASPFVVGTVVKCKLDSKQRESIVGGSGRWGDLYVACDCILRNSRKQQQITKIIALSSEKVRIIHNKENAARTTLERGNNESFHQI